LRSIIALCTLKGAPHGVDSASKLDDAAVAGALDDAAIVDGDSRVDEVAAERPKSRQNAILVCAGKPAISHHVRAQNGRKFAGPAHRESPLLSSTTIRPEPDYLKAIGTAPDRPPDGLFGSI
jgi:hypothetical protein